MFSRLKRLIASLRVRSTAILWILGASTATIVAGPSLMPCLGVSDATTSAAYGLAVVAVIAASLWSLFCLWCGAMSFKASQSDEAVRLARLLVSRTQGAVNALRRSQQTRVLVVGVCFGSLLVAEHTLMSEGFRGGALGILALMTLSAFLGGMWIVCRLARGIGASGAS